MTVAPACEEAWHGRRGAGTGEEISGAMESFPNGSGEEKEGGKSAGRAEFSFMQRRFDLTEEESRNPYSGCGKEDSTYILEKDICDKFPIAGIQQESFAFKCEGTESGECSEEAYEKDGHPFLIQRQFCFPEDETESGEKGSDDIDEKSPCGQSGQELADSAHTSIAEKSSCKTCASCQEEYFHDIRSFCSELFFIWGARQLLQFFRGEVFPSGSRGIFLC